MKIESISCDYCDSVFKLDSKNFFTIEGKMEFGKKEIDTKQKSNNVIHICLSCFAKKMNLNIVNKKEQVPTYGLDKRSHCDGIIGQGDMY